MEKIKVTVHIAGKDYTITTRDSKEQAERIARLVERKMTELSIVTRMALADTAALTAMDLCDDLLKAQDEITYLRAKLEETEAALAQERALGEAQA